MSIAVNETYELVKDGILGPEDFRKFVFTNAAQMYTSVNPDIFRGTIVDGEFAAEVGRATKGNAGLPAGVAGPAPG